MKGRYTSIVADLTGLASEVTLDMSLCNVGIMGSKYSRNTQPPLTIEITVGETKSLTIENIAVDPDPKFEIGNTLTIKLRQNPYTELPWITITQGISTARVDLST